MKRLLALLLLAGCNSQDDAASGGGGQSAVPGADLAALQNQNGANPAELQARAAAALSSILVDSASARYANIRAGASNAVCGDVDFKQVGGKYTGFRPFVVSPEGVAVISRNPTVVFNDPNDPFPDFYIRWCASPEELKNLTTRVAAGDPSLRAPAPDMPLDNISMAAPGGEPVRDIAAALPPRATAPEPARPSPRPAGERPAGTAAGDEDSFFKAVKRKADE